MDKKSEIIKNENIKKDIKEAISQPSDMIENKKCGKCKKTKSALKFNRNGKDYKVCNECDNKKSEKPKKEPVKKIIDLTGAKKNDDDEIKKIIVAETLENNELKTLKIENTAAEVEKQIDEKLKQTPLEKINALEKLCGLDLTKEEEYGTKSDNDKVEYQKILITKMTKLYENKMNPLSWMLLMGANVAEKNAYLLNYAGLEVDLTGYQKELYEHKQDLDAVCLEIMTETPEMLYYINNPYVKLSLIMSQCGLNVALRNSAKKGEASGSNSNHV